MGAAKSTLRCALVAAVCLAPCASRSNPVSTLYSFQGKDDGQGPAGGLTNYDGDLYGVTTAGGSSASGTIFSYDLATGQKNTLYSFSSDGSEPRSGVIEYKGSLFGAAAFGGAGNSGALFRYDIATNKETTFYAFTGGNDGGIILSGLVAFKGAIYGTAFTDGLNSEGTIFKVNPKSNKLTVVYTFAGGSDAQSPNSRLVAAGNLLYGTSYYGGTFSSGTIFSFDPVSDKETPIFSFPSSMANTNPTGLVFDGGALYGVATQGGANMQGSIFKYDLTKNTVTILHSFDGTDGCDPGDTPAPYKGSLLGSATACGTDNDGTTYQINLKNGKFTVLHQFLGTEGARPLGVLLYDGLLYGTADAGGEYNDGALYAESP